MITCPNCNHQNPDGALQCEACYTPLPEMVACPSCSTPVQADASFCGQCGYDLRSNLLAGPSGVEKASSEAAMAEPSKGIASSNPSGSSSGSPSGSPIGGATEVSAIPNSSIPTQNFLIEPASPTNSFTESGEFNSGELNSGELSGELNSDPTTGSAEFELPDLVAPDPLIMTEPIGTVSGSSDPNEASQPAAEATVAPAPESAPPEPIPMASPMASPATQLQTLSARLRQVQTDTLIEIPRQLSVVRIGKPNDQTPPDVDVSGFPDSEVVSRVHANLRIEGDVYYIEDVGSSNGTYINGLPLAAGNRHRLRPGDRIALGKGDKVSFIFETA